VQNAECEMRNARADTWLELNLLRRTSWLNETTAVIDWRGWLSFWMQW
jgi:hypothetical protein